MHNKNENRKEILQQLLEKSEVFNNYFKKSKQHYQHQPEEEPQQHPLYQEVFISENEENKKFYSNPNSNPKSEQPRNHMYETVQFGKCELRSNERNERNKLNNTTTTTTSKFNRKIMIMSKSRNRQKEVVSVCRNEQQHQQQNNNNHQHQHQQQHSHQHQQQPYTEHPQPYSHQQHPHPPPQQDKKSKKHINLIDNNIHTQRRYIVDNISSSFIKKKQTSMKLEINSERRKNKSKISSDSVTVINDVNDDNNDDEAVTLIDNHSPYHPNHSNQQHRYNSLSIMTTTNKVNNEELLLMMMKKVQNIKNNKDVNVDNKANNEQQHHIHQHNKQNNSNCCCCEEENSFNDFEESHIMSPMKKTANRMISELFMAGGSGDGDNNNNEQEQEQYDTESPSPLLSPLLPFNSTSFNNPAKQHEDPQQQQRQRKQRQRQLSICNVRNNRIYSAKSAKICPFERVSEREKKIEKEEVIIGNGCINLISSNCNDKEDNNNVIDDDKDVDNKEKRNVVIINSSSPTGTTFEYFCEKIPRYQSAFKERKRTTYHHPAQYTTENSLSPDNSPYRHQQQRRTLIQNHHQHNQQQETTVGAGVGKKYQTLLGKNYQQKLEEEKKNKIIQRKELNKTYNRAFVPPPKISAHSYAVYEMKSNVTEVGKVLVTSNGKSSQEVASLTKIMTCITVLEISQRFELDLSECTVEIGRFESSIGGTSAQIKPGEVYTVENMLYGLMLPSGNDASLALGVWGGRQLLENDDRCAGGINSPVLNSNTNTITISNSNSNSNSISISKSPQKTREDTSENGSAVPKRKYQKKEYISRFLEQMNEKARELNMNKTKYANTHGLVNNENRSSAIDIAFLSEYAMLNEKFAKIVSTKCYKATIKYRENVAGIDSAGNSSRSGLRPETAKTESQPLSQPLKEPINQPINQSQNQQKQKQETYKQKEVCWENTHRLVQRKSNEYIGIKTGVTTVAGPCLSSCVFHKQSGRKFIIVLLNCNKMLDRFKETEILKKWLYKQEGFIGIKKKEQPIQIGNNNKKPQSLLKQQKHHHNPHNNQQKRSSLISLKSTKQQQKEQEESYEVGSVINNNKSDEDIEDDYEDYDDEDDCEENEMKD